MGAAIAALALDYGTWIVAEYFIFGVRVPGWATVVAGTMFLSGVQLLSMGVLGECIGRILDEVRQRPIYVVQMQGGRSNGAATGETQAKPHTKQEWQETGRFRIGNLPPPTHRRACGCCRRRRHGFPNQVAAGPARANTKRRSNCGSAASRRYTPTTHSKLRPITASRVAELTRALSNSITAATKASRPTTS